MEFGLKIFIVFSTIFAYLYIIYEIKKTNVNVKDIVSWILFSLLFLLISFFPKVVEEIAKLFKFKMTSNFIFFSCLIILFYLSFKLTIKNSMLEKKIKILVQEIALEKCDSLNDINKNNRGETNE